MMGTLSERTDCTGNVWYWVEGENDTTTFYQIPEMPKLHATELAALHKNFNDRICAYAQY